VVEAELMMGNQIIFILLPLIIGSALVPFQIIVVILILNNPNQGLVKGIAFITGMTIIRLLQGVIFGFILTPNTENSIGKNPIVYAFLLVLGVLLLISAYKKWDNQTYPDDPPPKWMGKLDSFTLRQVFGIGAGLVLISGKLWVFTLSAIGEIASAQLGRPTSIVVFISYILLAQSLLIVLVAVRGLFPQRSKSSLEVFSAWLVRNNRPIVVSVSLVFGLLFLLQGAFGLLSF
jgi:hypothetical protein